MDNPPIELQIRFLQFLRTLPDNSTELERCTKEFAFWLRQKDTFGEQIIQPYIYDVQKDITTSFNEETRKKIFENALIH
jgi:hypothetical protein